jgi:hypothetical protein
VKAKQMAQQEVGEIDEAARVIAWRAHVLSRSGFPPEEAFLLAEHPDVDLHTALDLLEAGCPPETAIRILT